MAVNRFSCKPREPSFRLDISVPLDIPIPPGRSMEQDTSSTAAAAAAVSIFFKCVINILLGKTVKAC
jgi:hypothetical protein